MPPSNEPKELHRCGIETDDLGSGRRLYGGDGGARDRVRSGCFEPPGRAIARDECGRATLRRGQVDAYECGMAEARGRVAREHHGQGRDARCPPRLARNRFERSDARGHRDEQPGARAGERPRSRRTGRAECCGLVQALVTPRAETALAGKAGVDRVRPPYAQIQTAVSGEQVGVDARSGVAREGIHRQGRQGGRHRRRLQGPRRETGVGDLPANVVTQDSVAASCSDGRGSRHRRRGDRPRDGARLRSSTSSASAPRSTSPPPWRRRRARASQVINHSAGWEGPVPQRRRRPVQRGRRRRSASGILWVNSAGNEATRTGPAATTRRELRTCGARTATSGNSFVWPERHGHLRLPEVGRVAGRRLRLRPRAVPVGLEHACIASSEGEQGEAAASRRSKPCASGRRADAISSSSGPSRL